MGDALRIGGRDASEHYGGPACSATGRIRATTSVAVHALNRMLELGRPISVRIASTQAGLASLCSSYQTLQHGSSIVQGFRNQTMP